VQLNLHAYRQPIAQDPFRKDSRVQSAMDWRKQYRAGTVQPMLTHHLDRPPVVAFVTEHKLYLIMVCEALNVAPEIFSTSPEPGVLMSRILDTRSSTSDISSAPLVSSDTE
jgi:hypothetical protein